MEYSAKELLSRVNESMQELKEIDEYLEENNKHTERTREELDRLMSGHVEAYIDLLGLLSEDE